MSFPCILVSDPIDPNCEYRNIHWYIIGGQSNAVGQSNVSDLSPENSGFAQPFDQILYSETIHRYSSSSNIYSVSCVDLEPKPSGQFGPELSLGRCLVETPPSGFDPAQDCIALVKFGSGASQIKYWLESDPLGVGIWPFFESFLRSQISKLTDLACGRLICERFYWIQGESDRTESRAADYADDFQSLLASLESIVPDCEKVFSNLQENGNAAIANGHARTINQSIRDLNCIMTGSNDDLERQDSVHYGADANITLGQRLCNAS